MNQIFQPIYKRLTTYLKVEVETLAQIDFLWETFVFAHVESQSVVSVGVFSFREEDGVVEANKLTARHSL